MKHYIIYNKFADELSILKSDAYEKDIQIATEIFKETLCGVADDIKWLNDLGQHKIFTLNEYFGGYVFLDFINHDTLKINKKLNDMSLSMIQFIYNLFKENGEYNDYYDYFVQSNSKATKKLKAYLEKRLGIKEDKVKDNKKNKEKLNNKDDEDLKKLKGIIKGKSTKLKKEKDRV